MRGIQIRPIETSDDAAVAALIRSVMTDFGCSGDGFAMVDPEVDAMTAAYAAEGARFYVVLETGAAESAIPGGFAGSTHIRGCGGFAPLAGAERAHPGGAAIAELRKMYFLPELRGRGVGSLLLTHLLDTMRTDNYASCYLETTSWMPAAQALYRKHGFRELPSPMGQTGHSGCDRFFLRDLKGPIESAR